MRKQAPPSRSSRRTIGRSTEVKVVPELSYGNVSIDSTTPDVILNVLEKSLD
jgi:hypothetical protein